jgi:hypothetical protein
VTETIYRAAVNGTMGRKKQYPEPNAENLTVKPKTAETREKPDIDFPDTWPDPSDKSKEAMRLAGAMFSTKHGLFAAIPLVCKGEQCPYAKTCIAVYYDTAPTGERCPIEIMDIKNKFMALVQSLQLDENNMANTTLLKELIDSEIMIDRANKIIASTGDLIVDVVAVVSESGEAYTRPEIHKAVEIKDKYVKRKNEILQLLNSTPKDKAKMDDLNRIDPSQYAADILARAEIMRNKDGK